MFKTAVSLGPGIIRHRSVYVLNLTAVALSDLSLKEGIEHYFRLAVRLFIHQPLKRKWLTDQFVQGGAALDYINPVTLFSNGTWSL